MRNISICGIIMNLDQFVRRTPGSALSPAYKMFLRPNNQCQGFSSDKLSLSLFQYRLVPVAISVSI